jgi:hypothetical protein
MPPTEKQNAHENALETTLAHLGGDRESDWALVRALVHKAIHVAHDRRAGDFCAVAMLLAEMTQHAHTVLHSAHRVGN